MDLVHLFCAKVREELGGDRGHAALSASGCFLGDWAELSNVEDFAWKSVRHHSEALSQLPDQTQRLPNLVAWLRNTVLGPLLGHLLINSLGATDAEAACVVAEWVAADVTFHGGLEKIKATSAAARGQAAKAAEAGIVTPQGVHGTAARRILRARRTLPVAAAQASSAATARPGTARDSLAVGRARAVTPQRLSSTSAVPPPTAPQLATGPSTNACVGVVPQGARRAARSAGSASASLSLEEERWKDYCGGHRFGNKTNTQHEDARIDNLLKEQGWALRLLGDSMIPTFQKLLSVRYPHTLGKGRDIAVYGRTYSRLEVMYAWQIISPERRAAYHIQRDALARDRARAEKQGVSVPTVSSRLSAIGKNLQEPLQANEGWFLHGTKPENVLPILSAGLSEKMCTGKFGKGVYLAEDPEKPDQYVTPDTKYMAPGLEDLHKRLYRARCARHPNEDLFYVFAVRAAAGIPVRTRDGTSDLDRSSGEIFANSDKRELSEVPGVTPPLLFHSLVVELGGALGRFREFVHFNSARFSVEYLIAYRRLS